jgi:hypothetical protein
VTERRCSASGYYVERPQGCQRVLTQARIS